MLDMLATVRTWFSRPAGLPPLPEPTLAEALALTLPPEMAQARTRRTSEVWPPQRLAIAELLWGEGFIGPGGAEEVLRLARPLGGSSATSLLLLGGGSGGPPRALADGMGMWVHAVEADPALAAAATARCAQGGSARRISVAGWMPDDPSFRPRAYHHAIAIEPLRGAAPVPILTALAEALRPGGHVMLTELVADLPLPIDDRAASVWAQREGRTTLDVPGERDITRALGRLGFDVRVTEDLTARHVHLALLGWRVLVRTLARDRPSAAHAAWIVHEAELWMHRIALLRAGRLRLLRWHAIAGRPPAAASAEA